MQTLPARFRAGQTKPQPERLLFESPDQDVLVGKKLPQRLRVWCCSERKQVRTTYQSQVSRNKCLF